MESTDKDSLASPSYKNLLDAGKNGNMLSLIVHHLFCEQA